MADDIDQTTRDVTKMHEEIVAALRVLVSDGILKKEDFGNFFGFGSSSRHRQHARRRPADPPTFAVDASNFGGGGLGNGAGGRASEFASARADRDAGESRQQRNHSSA